MFAAAIRDKGHLACIRRERWALLNGRIRSKRAEVRTVYVGGPKIRAAGARRTEHHPAASRRNAGLQVAAKPVREVAQPGASLNRDRDRDETARVLNELADESTTGYRHAWRRVLSNSWFA